MRRALGFATGLMALVGLAQPGLASAQRAASTNSTTLAGYAYNGYIAVPDAVSAIVVVPKLKCQGTPSAGRWADAAVGIQSVNSYAGLLLVCTHGGTARYYPSLDVNGTVKNYPGDLAHAGDKVELAVSQSASQVTDSVTDQTHKFNASSNGGGSGTGSGPTIETAPVTGPVCPSGCELPNFGTLHFSNALVNGLPFGSVGQGLQGYNLYASSSNTLRIRATAFASNKEAFTTVFKHS